MAYSRRQPIVVFAAEFWTGSTGAGLAHGLRNLGWLVHEIDIQSFVGRPASVPPSKLAYRLHRRLAVPAYLRRVLEDCHTLRPDLLLTVKGTEINAETLQQIRALGVRTANFYPDYHFGYGNFDQSTIALYDDFVTTKSFQLDWLRGQRHPDRTYYIPHGYCDLVHQPVYRTMTEGGHSCEVGYAGNHSAYKASQLGELLHRLPDLDLSVTGPNWHNLKGLADVRRSLEGRERRNIAFAEFIQRSKINLAFHYGAAANGWADLVSTRSFEIPACGGFMLHVDNDEIRQFYKVGEEIDTFASISEMADKIAYYLQRPDVRERMISRARERAVPAYGYAARAGELVQALGLQNGGRV